LESYEALREAVAADIRHWYTSRDADGHEAEALYYFWVKVVPCVRCGAPVDLFSSYVFARHAYSDRNPEAKAVCPRCGRIVPIRYDADEVACTGCSLCFDPAKGPARGAKMCCTACGVTADVVRAVQAIGRAPAHRMYAKLVLSQNGAKSYEPITPFDLELFAEAASELSRRDLPLPTAEIASGYNTNQVRNYCYTSWRDMFNDRQLLCLGTLKEAILTLQDPGSQAALLCLFSGCLEFNNMFASYKGEGTGAVRHMFAHHILKPERAPLEANLWGTAKSSGSFSTLFRSRILKGFEYSAAPFEIRCACRRPGATDRVYGLSAPMGAVAADCVGELENGARLYLRCGDSAHTDLPSGSVDAVVTDPPFFDNVHYSELADFFAAWIPEALSLPRGPGATTRSSSEVQHGDASEFCRRLTGVWRECRRVLKPDGVLVFTYHHSRLEGWSAILESLVNAGFVITACQPVKSEMSVAAPKAQSKAPIDLDIIMVCRPVGCTFDTLPIPIDLLDAATEASAAQIRRFNRAARTLGRNDVQIILMSHVVRLLSQARSNPHLPATERLAASAFRLFGSQLVAGPAAQETLPGLLDAT
jgi:adenine-specific DNA methylase